MLSFFHGLSQFVFRLIFWLFAALAATSLLAVAVLALSFSVLKSLFTGRKSAPLVAFGRFKTFSQTAWPAGAFSTGRTGGSTAAQAKVGEVVDVEVREIREEATRP